MSSYWHVTLLIPTINTKPVACQTAQHDHTLTVHQMFVCVLRSSSVTTHNSTPDVYIPIVPC